jgi:hypothetical protein
MGKVRFWCLESKLSQVKKTGRLVAKDNKRRQDRMDRTRGDLSREAETNSS